MISHRTNLHIVLPIAVACLMPAGLTSAVEFETLTEEVVTRFTPAGNGAGPLWCYGSPLVVRDGETVWVSVIETGANVPPLCNTRWQLWRRAGGVWQVVHQEQEYRQREPCPLVVLPGKGLFLSANPSTEPPGRRYGPCRPILVSFSMDDPGTAPVVEQPAWSSGARFTDHSYRGLAADGERGELLLLNIDAESSAQYVSFRDGQGEWHARGTLTFPIRSAYPQVALRYGAAYVMAIGDIREPVAEWQKLKFEKLNRDWDYVFRRLFYASTPDVAHREFSEPLEVDSVEDTAGHITNLDLHVDSDGAAHLLYLKRPHLYDFIRDAYFPGQPMTKSLEHVVIRDGRVVQRTTLAATPRDSNGLEPDYARFHVTSDGNLHVLVSGTMNQQGSVGRPANCLLEVSRPTQVRELALKHPFRTFFTNTPRGGCPPSDTIDLFGIADDAPNLRYASVRLR